MNNFAFNQQLEEYLENQEGHIGTRVVYSSAHHYVFNYALENDVSDDNIRTAFRQMWTECGHTFITITAACIGFILYKLEDDDDEIVFRYFWPSNNTNILPKANLKFKNSESYEQFLNAIPRWLNIEQKLARAPIESAWRVAYISNIEFHVYFF